MEMEIIHGSSNVAALGYDEKRKVLCVRFHHGGEYEYSVSRARYESIRDADSVGKAVVQLRKDGIEGTKV